MYTAMALCRLQSDAPGHPCRSSVSIIDMNPDDLLDFTVETARDAGTILYAAVNGEMSVETKSTVTDMVTDVDTRTEQFILTRIRERFPDHGIVAEESGVTDVPDSPYRWLIDPLDGTNNFVNGIPFFCTSMALYSGDKPLVGVVYNPISGECFTASSGGGSFLTQADGTKTQIHVSGASSLMESIIATGFSYDKHINPDNNLKEFAAVVPRVRGIRRFGSAALDCAFVAAGRLDGYWESGINAWDIGAGQLLVQEAGGKSTQIPAGRDVHVFTNGLVHDELIAVLRSARR